MLSKEFITIFPYITFKTYTNLDRPSRKYPLAYSTWTWKTRKGTIYFNSDTLKSFSAGEIEAVLWHEVGHILYTTKKMSYFESETLADYFASTAVGKKRMFDLLVAIGCENRAKAIKTQFWPNRLATSFENAFKTLQDGQGSTKRSEAVGR